MTGAEDESIDLSLASLTMDEIMKLLVEAEEYVKHFSQTISDIRAELRERVHLDEPYDYVAPDPEGGMMGYTVRAMKTRGAHRWKYNPKQVMNQIEETNKHHGFVKKVLDTGTFNTALNNNPSVVAEFEDVVSSTYDKDGLRITGIDKLLKARGMQK